MVTAYKNTDKQTLIRLSYDDRKGTVEQIVYIDGYLEAGLSRTIDVDSMIHNDTDFKEYCDFNDITVNWES